MELTVPAAATALTLPVVAERRLHRSCAAVVAQQEVVAESRAAAAVVVAPAAKCLMYLEPTRPDQWLDQCCAAMQPWPDSSR
jgi:hypothetical protein